MKSIITTVLVVCGSMSFSASATFVIDYQGVELKKETPLKRVTPDGYKMLTGKYRGLIEEVGTGTPENIGGFGTDSPLSEALYFIMPQGWFAFVDETAGNLPPVSWDNSRAESSWLDVLADIGHRFGFRYVVDWDQRMIQIAIDQDYVKPDYNEPVVYSDQEGKREVYIYTRKPSISGYFLQDGKVIPVKAK